MKCGDCINYGTCRHTCNVVRISDICSSFLGKLSCDGCKYDSDRFSDICYHDCIMFSDYQKEDISIPKEKPMNKVIFESEEEAKDFFNKFIWSDTNGECLQRFIDNLKYHSAIRKSPVEEAEEMYKNFLHEYENPGVDTSWSNTVACIKKQHEALQEQKNVIKTKDDIIRNLVRECEGLKK